MDEYQPYRGFPVSYEKLGVDAKIGFQNKTTLFMNKSIFDELLKEGILNSGFLPYGATPYGIYRGNVTQFIPQDSNTILLTFENGSSFAITVVEAIFLIKNGLVSSAGEDAKAILKEYEKCADKPTRRYYFTYIKDGNILVKDTITNTRNIIDIQTLVNIYGPDGKYKILANCYGQGNYNQMGIEYQEELEKNIRDQTLRDAASKIADTVKYSRGTKKVIITLKNGESQSFDIEQFVDQYITPWCIPDRGSCFGIREDNPLTLTWQKANIFLEKVAEVRAERAAYKENVERMFANDREEARKRAEQDQERVHERERAERERDRTERAERDRTERAERDRTERAERESSERERKERERKERERKEREREKREREQETTRARARATQRDNDDTDRADWHEQTRVADEQRAQEAMKQEEREAGNKDARAERDRIQTEEALRNKKEENDRIIRQIEKDAANPYFIAQRNKLQEDNIPLYNKAVESGCPASKYKLSTPCTKTKVERKSIAKFISRDKNPGCEDYAELFVKEYDKACPKIQ